MIDKEKSTQFDRWDPITRKRTTHETIHYHGRFSQEVFHHQTDLLMSTFKKLQQHVTSQAFFRYFDAMLTIDALPIIMKDFLVSIRPSFLPKDFPLDNEDPEVVEVSQKIDELTLEQEDLF